MPNNLWSSSVLFNFRSLLSSYSTVVLYIGIMKVRDIGPKLSPQNQLDIYFLSIAKPKNVFRSILNLNSYEILKILYLADFSTD